MRLSDQIARTLDAPPALLPFVPELLQDLEALSGDVDELLAVLDPIGLSAGSRVLDLGCGKGAVALALARRHGCRVLGIDGLPAFVEHARERAREASLAGLCTFLCEDLRATLARPHGDGPADLALLVGVGRPFGTLEDTILALRNAVRPGGHLLVDDAFLADGVPSLEEHPGYADHRATLQALTWHGDHVVTELLRTDSGEEFLTRTLAQLTRRAHDLARVRPELTPLVEEFLATQRRETDELRGPLMPALWLLARS